MGKGDDQSAAGHPVRAHLDHHVAVRQAFQIGLALGGVGGQSHFDQGFAIADAVRAGVSHEFKNFPQRNSDLHEMQRQPENFTELPVRADQLQIRVEDGNALAHMVQRGLQDFTVEVQGCVGIVE